MTDGVWIWLRAVATDKEGFRGGLGYLLRTAPGSLRARSRPGSERLYRQLQQPGSGGPPGRQRGNGAASRAYTGSGPEGASTSARLPQTAPAGSQPPAAGSPPRRPPSPPRSHHTGNQQTRQPSAGSRRPGTGRAEGQDTRADANREQQGRGGHARRPRMGVASGRRLQTASKPG